MGKNRLAERIVGVSLPLMAALALSVVAAPAAGAATNRCPWSWQAKSCSTYATVEETRHMFEATRGPVGRLDSDICDVVFDDEDGAADTYCSQLLITETDVQEFDQVLTEAYRSNGCIEFHRPAWSRTAGMVASKAKVHTGQYCDLT